MIFLFKCLTYYCSRDAILILFNYFLSKISRNKYSSQAPVRLKAYLRIFLRSLNRAIREIRIFTERRLAVRLCNPLSGNRDVSDGKFSSVLFSFVRIIIHSFTFHLHCRSTCRSGFSSAFKRRVSSAKLAITCPVLLFATHVGREDFPQFRNIRNLPRRMTCRC